MESDGDSDGTVDLTPPRPKKKTPQPAAATTATASKQKKDPPSTSTSTSTPLLTTTTTPKSKSKSKPKPTGNPKVETFNVDDDDFEAQLQAAMKRSLEDQQRSTVTPSKRLKLNGDGTATNAISLLDSDDDDDDDDDDNNKEVMNIDSDTVAMEVASESDPEVEFMSAQEIQAMQQKVTTTTTSDNAASGEESDDEVQAVGVKNACNLPHMRQHCVECKFIPDMRSKLKSASGAVKVQAAEGSKANPKTCEKCYCYVCDKPANECNQWSNLDNVPEKKWHCHASDKGNDSHFWTTYRENKKKKARGTLMSASSCPPSPQSRNSGGGGGFRTAPATLASATARSAASALNVFRTLMGVYSDDEDEDLFGLGLHRLNSESDMSRPESPLYSAAPNTVTREGPYPPDDANAKKNRALTKCRSCGWYNVFEHKNFTRMRAERTKNAHGVWETKRVVDKHAICSKDWCHACGRVASKRDFQKEQTVKPRVVGMTFLGEKSIPFTIHARDPRTLEPFKSKWDEFGDKSDKWRYDAKELEKDFYEHRLGKRPHMKQILSCIPVLSEEALFEADAKAAGTVQGWNSHLSAMELEYIKLPNQRDTVLFEELYSFDCMNGTPSDCQLAFDVTSSWDEKKRSGKFDVKLYLKQGAVGMSQYRSMKQKLASFTRLLGSFYDIFPLKLHELIHGIPAEKATQYERRRLLRSNTGLVKSQLTRTEMDELMDTFAPGEQERFDDYNREANDVYSSLHFQSSSGSRSGGGVSGSDCSFAGLICRYLRECLPEEVMGAKEGTTEVFGVSDVGKDKGIISTHRQIRTLYGSNECPMICRISQAGTDTAPFPNYVEEDQKGLLIHNLSKPLEEMYNRCSSFGGIMQQLENLGHSAVDHTEGLNVELFDFQKQAVAWALEREQAPWGLNSFLWAKLPGNNNLYYSPLFNAFIDRPPKSVRGGFIAAEMGLGKTVISLSLLLKNPAPHLPASGTKTKDWRNKKKDWSHEAGADATDRNAGSIISRGTLVVCNVSLVGQWIDEAKSKLRNPGLVYSYHGTNRTRNAEKLASNSVVVTTYATLSSDNNFHRKKSRDPATYVAPCAQVKWWRVICDESHALKDTNTHHFKALDQIQACNRWCVTGTPMNTSLNDIKGQMKFIGMEGTDSMFGTFANKMQNLFGSGRRRGRFSNQESHPGDLMFTLRSIMIRHSIKQRGRSSQSDLMSLPPKEEKIIRLSFSQAERKEYEKVEKKAADYYKQIKASSRDVNKHYLKIQSAFMPIRVACSGGLCDEESEQNTKMPNAPNAFKMCPDRYSTECSICLDTLSDPVVTKCTPMPHVFCRECIEGSLDMSGICPTCRQPVQAKHLRCAVFKGDTDEEDKKPSADKDDSDGKKKKKKNPFIPDIPFKTKFNRLLRELTLIRDNEPESKSLVFSQFASTLQWMKQELPKHGFTFRTLSGDMPMKARAKALRDFQQDPPTTIFLLSMRSGAVGINLTQANRVFLMEPAMNPALEAQAIGRVYRLGQRKSVKIIRFIMENSFETRLLKVHERKFGTKIDAKDSSSSNDKKPAATNGEDKKPSATEKSNASQGATASASQTPSAVIGHVYRDKISSNEAEFDELFGV